MLNLRSVKNLKIISAIFSIVLIVVSGVWFFKSEKTEAIIDYGNANANLRGFAWSDTAGWISFNSRDCDTNNNGFVDSGNCGGNDDASTPLYNYGVTAATSAPDKYLYGYAWSSNLGWISFNKKTCDGADAGMFCVNSSDCPNSNNCSLNNSGAVGAPPSAPYNGAESYLAKYDKNTTRLTGWAKALSMGDNGWIRLNDIDDISSANLILNHTFNYDKTDWNNKTAKDSVSNNNNSIVGDILPARGKSGWGIKLDGSGDYVDLGNSLNSINKNSNFSVSAWIKADNMANRQSIISSRESSGGAPGWSAMIDAGKFSFGLFQNNGDKISATTQASFSSLAWHYVVMTYDGSVSANGIKIYIDGKEEATDKISNSLNNMVNSAIVSIGSENGATAFFAGVIDEVRVYNKVLSADEALKLFQNGASLEYISSANGEFHGWAWSGRKVRICDGGVNEGKVCVAAGDCPSSSCGTAEYDDSGIGWISLNGKNCDADDNNFIDNYNSYSMSVGTDFSSTHKRDNATARLTNGLVMVVSSNNGSDGKYFLYKEDGSLMESGNIAAAAFTYPAIAALPDGNALIVYTGGVNIGYYVIYNQTLKTISAPVIFNNSVTAYTSVATLSDGKILVAYDDNIKIFNPATGQFGSALQFNSGNDITYISVTALLSGNALVVFRDLSLTGKYVIYNSSPESVSSPVQFSDPFTQTNDITVAVLTDDKAIIAYDNVTSRGVFKIYDISDNSLGAPINFSASQPAYLSVSGLKNGNAVISYTDSAGDNLYFSVYNYNGDKLSEPSLISSNANIKDVNSVSLNNGSVFVAYDNGSSSNGKFNIITPKGCGEDNLTIPTNNYKVYTTDPFLLNSPPIAINMTAPNLTDASLCGEGATKDARNIQLQWQFFDIDQGASQFSYQVVMDKNDHAADAEIEAVATGLSAFNSGKKSGAAESVFPKNEGAVIEYNTPYYWWVKVWDYVTVNSEDIEADSSPWMKYNTQQDTNNDNAEQYTFTTYKHEFPDAYFKWFPLEPSKDEATLFTDLNSKYYSYATPTTNSSSDCFDPATGNNNCTYSWSSSGTGIAIANPTASSTNITFSEAKIGNKKINLEVRDSDYLPANPDDYRCLTSTTFNANIKLPIWKEVKY